MNSRGTVTLAVLSVLVFTARVRAEGQAARVDLYGDELPPGAVARMGCVHYTHAENGLAVSPNGEILATAGVGGLRFWEIGTGKLLHHVRGGDSDYCYPRFAGEGKILVAKSSEGLRFWDVKSGRVVRTLRGEGAGYVFDISRDGKILVSTDGNRKVWIWAAETGEVRRVLEVHDEVNTIAISPDGKMLASAGVDKDFDKSEKRVKWETTVRLWDVASGRKLWQAPGGGDWTMPIRALTFSPDGTKLAVPKSDCPLRVLDTVTGEPLYSCREKWDESTFAAFTPDGKLLVGGISCRKLWDARTGRVVEDERLRHWDGGGRFVAVSGKNIVYGDSRVQFWDLSQGKEVNLLPGHQGAITSLALTPDGDTLITASEDKTIRYWDVRTGRERRVVRGHEEPIVRIALSPDGKILASVRRFTGYWIDGVRQDGLDDGPPLYLWDVANGKFLRALSTGGAHSAWDTQLAFSPDGRTLAITKYPGVQLFDVASGQPKRFLNDGKDSNKKRQEWATSFAFRPDGEKMLVQAHPDLDSNYFSFWDIESGKRGESFPATKGHYCSISCSPNGRVVCDGRTLWDAETLRPLRELASTPYDRLDSSFHAFSPDGKLVASTVRGGVDGPAIWVWEVSTGQRVLEFAGHMAKINSGAFGPDSQTLMSAGDDRTALVWDLRTPPGVPVLPPGAVLGAKELERLWLALDGKEAADAYRAICRLSASPREAVPLLKKHLPSAPPRDARRIRELVQDLDSDRFAVREAAAGELEKIGYIAEPELRDAQTKATSLEARRRAKALLNSPAVKAGGEPPTVRQLRAIQVLERIGSPEACAVLREVAGDRPLANLTREAVEALQRLERRRIGR